MKIILITTTFLVAVLAIGLIGINNDNNNNNKISNAFAQENAVSIAAGSLCLLFILLLKNKN